MKRWTLDELSKTSDRQFLLTLLNERKEKCTNPYAPLTQRIDATLRRLENGSSIGDDGNIR